MEFNLDGTLKFVELDIMNLNNMAIWDKVGGVYLLFAFRAKHNTRTNNLVQIGTWTETGIEIKG